MYDTVVLQEYLSWLIDQAILDTDNRDAILQDMRVCDAVLFKHRSVSTLELMQFDSNLERWYDKGISHW